MHGRSCSALLAIILLTLSTLGPPCVLWAQSQAALPLPHQPRHLPGPYPGGPNPSGPTQPPLTFTRLAQTAGSIFEGTVTNIETGSASGPEDVPIVAVTFRVERPLRGVGSGSLTLREWLGLWSGGQRYTIGQHVLLFLYPPSKLGLTSSVGGAMGRFNLDASGAILPTQAQLNVFRSDPLLAGRLRIPFNDFADSLRRASGEQASK